MHNDECFYIFCRVPRSAAQAHMTNAAGSGRGRGGGRGSDSGRDSDLAGRGGGAGNLSAMAFILERFSFQQIEVAIASTDSGPSASTNCRWHSALVISPPLWPPHPPSQSSSPSGKLKSVSRRHTITLTIGVAIAVEVRARLGFLFLHILFTGIFIEALTNRYLVHSLFNIRHC